MRPVLAISLVFALLAGCGDAPPTAPPAGDLSVDLDLELVADGFEGATMVTTPVGDDRLFVSEQSGRIWVVQNGEVLSSPFLDLTDDINVGFELGLLGFAFHPRYADNGFLYVAYSDPDNATRLDRFTVSAFANLVDQSSRRNILTVPQPFDHHNGGHVVFGPDGMLYLGLGDGGHEPEENVAQDPMNLYGTIVRLDVDARVPYAAPSDNPFAGSTTAGLGEIWAYGLRNPWRFAFDHVEAVLYIGDVGEQSREEINAQPAAAGGLNYGWSTMEGTECLAATPCETAGLTMPAIDYAIGPDGCSVIGGFVYRGGAIPEIAGHYFYSDWCGGWLRSFRYEAGTVSHETEWDVRHLGQTTSFGQDGDGELLVVNGREVYRLVAEGR